MSWSEFRIYKQRLTYESPLEVAIDLYRAVLLDGPTVEFVSAGMVEYVANFLLETNPFGGEYEDIAYALNAKRSNQDYLENAKAMVAAIFRYSFEEIDSWDVDTFFDRVAKAEFISGKQLDPQKVKTAEEIAAEQAAARAPKPPPKLQKKPMTPGQQLSWDRVQSQKRS